MNRILKLCKVYQAATAFMLTALVFFPAAAWPATVPPLVNYQGRLMDSGGMPVTGSVPATFALWDAPTAGTELWMESKAVEVSGGLYSVLLGDSVAIPASVFSGSTVYLEVTVLGETLAPRERLTAVPYAFHADDSDNLGGIPASGYAQVGNIDFSGITGTATDAQIPDNITISLAQNSTDLGGLPAADYVLVAGDTVTGDLQINGTLRGHPDLKIANNLTVQGGGIGLGIAPNPTYGILNSLAAPTYGAYLYGTASGIEGINTADIANIGSLGTASAGVSGYGGNAASSGLRYGGYFVGESQNNAYGVYTLAYGDGTGSALGVNAFAQANGAAQAFGGNFIAASSGTGDQYGVAATAIANSAAVAYGIYAVGDNSSTGDSYAGFFENNNSGTGNHYGIWADADTYPGYFAWSPDPANHYTYLAAPNYGIYTNVGSSSYTDVAYGARFSGSSQSLSYGVDSSAYGYGPNTTNSVYAAAYNYSSGSALGGYFVGAGSGTGIHYGIYSSATGSSTNPTYGISANASNSSSADAYGGYFYVVNTGFGNHYGVYGMANGNGAYGVYGAAANGSYGVGVYGTSSYVGVQGAWATDPIDDYAELGSQQVAVYGFAGASITGYSQIGGEFTGYSDYYAAGSYNVSQASGSAEADGVYAEADNSGTGNSYGAYLYATATSGSAYGLYVASGSKNWVNPDPEDPGKSIVYSTLEGGENGTYYRGTARLVNGRAVIELPDHFRLVTSPDHPITVQVTPSSADSLGLAVTKKSNSEIVVEELYHGKGNYEFDYLVQGVRLGYEDYQPIIDNKDYVPFQGNLRNMDQSKTTTQEFYDHQYPGVKRILEKNGTLDQNGKVNEATFQARGWKEIKVHKPHVGPGRE